jgi:hypothetical protein
MAGKQALRKHCVQNLQAEATLKGAIFDEALPESEVALGPCQLFYELLAKPFDDIKV